jgi:hypothetical protein
MRIIRLVRNYPLFNRVSFNGKSGIVTCPVIIEPKEEVCDIEEEPIAMLELNDSSGTAIGYSRATQYEGSTSNYEVPTVNDKFLGSLSGGNSLDESERNNVIVK